VVVRYLSNGALDRSFGRRGIVRTPSGDSAIGHDPTGWATALVIEPDGKLVAGGTTSAPTCGGALLVRYRPDGSVDTTFGKNGRIDTQNAVLGALALAPDGSLLVSRLGDGGCEISSPGIDRIVRLKRNGAVDRGFGNGGKAATPLGVSSLAVQPDGKVVGAGSLWVTEGGTHEVSALVRYTSGGSPDRTFGAHGRATTPIHVAALALQRDGKIVGAGSDGPYSRTKLALVRYGRDGVLDRSFGTGGIVKTSLGEDAAAAAVVVQRNGKIVVAGFRRELPFQAKGSRKVFVLVRYEPNGRLDAAFGRGGIVTTQIGAGDSDARSLAIRPDGKVVAGGEAREGDFTSGRFAVAQYQP
jgi:uncharacterized delta-60 repeat protein